MVPRPPTLTYLLVVLMTHPSYIPLSCHGDGGSPPLPLLFPLGGGGLSCSSLLGDVVVAIPTFSYPLLMVVGPPPTLTLPSLVIVTPRPTFSYYLTVVVAFYPSLSYVLLVVVGSVLLPVTLSFSFSY